MELTEVAWAAGLFDGEGSIYPADRGQRVLICIGQSGELPGPPEVLVRFKDAMGGIGYVNGPYFREGKLPQWQWRSMRFEHAQAVVAFLWRYLSTPKRHQAASALSRANAYERKPTGRPVGANHWDESLYCKRGHPWTPDNTAIRTNKRTGYVSRACRACARASYHRNK